jgi:hypothetical protein
MLSKRKNIYKLFLLCCLNVERVGSEEGYCRKAWNWCTSFLKKNPQIVSENIQVKEENKVKKKSQVVVYNENSYHKENKEENDWNKEKILGYYHSCKDKVTWCAEKIKSAINSFSTGNKTKIIVFFISLYFFGPAYTTCTIISSFFDYLYGLYDKKDIIKKYKTNSIDEFFVTQLQDDFFKKNDKRIKFFMEHKGIILFFSLNAIRFITGFYQLDSYDFVMNLLSPDNFMIKTVLEPCFLELPKAVFFKKPALKDGEEEVKTEVNNKKITENSRTETDENNQTKKPSETTKNSQTTNSEYKSEEGIITKEIINIEKKIYNTTIPKEIIDFQKTKNKLEEDLEKIEFDKKREEAEKIENPNKREEAEIEINFEFEKKQIEKKLENTSDEKEKNILKEEEEYNLYKTYYEDKEKNLNKQIEEYDAKKEDTSSLKGNLEDTKSNLSKHILNNEIETLKKSKDVNEKINDLLLKIENYHNIDYEKNKKKLNEEIEKIKNDKNSKNSEGKINEKNQKIEKLEVEKNKKILTDKIKHLKEIDLKDKTILDRLEAELKTINNKNPDTNSNPPSKSKSFIVPVGFLAIVGVGCLVYKIINKDNENSADEI